MTILRRISAFCVLSLLVLGSAAPAKAFGGKPKDNRPDAAASVLAAFQGSCGSQGVFTQSANAQTSAIINVFESLKDTDACKPFAAELTSVQTAANSLQSLQSSSTYAAYQTDQNQYQLLTVALQTAQATASSKTASAVAVAEATSDVANYQGAIGKLRLQMFSDQAAYETSTQTFGGNQISANTSSMLSWAQQLTTASSSPDLAQCLQQSPMAALELGTNLVAYGGSLLPGAYGAGIATVSTLISNGLDALRDRQYDSAIFNAQTSEMRDSLSCALESMTESYCTMEDSYSLLDLARNNRLGNYAATPLWRGIDILNRQLPSLLQWLGQVQNEVPPQDSYQASKQNAVYQENFEVEQQNLNATAAINNAISQAQYASSSSAKLAAIVDAVANLSLQLVSQAVSITGGNSESSIPTPFGIYQPDAPTWACWLVRGPDYINCPVIQTDENSQGAPQLYQMVDYIQNNPLGLQLRASDLPVVMSSLLNNWNLIVPKVQVLVDSDFARIIATNAGTILASARAASNGSPLSPFEVLGNIQSFLNGISTTGNPELPLAISQELAKIQGALDQITKTDAEVCPPQVPAIRPIISFQSGAPIVVDPSPLPSSSPIPVTPADCQTQRLVKIFNFFGLQNGTQVFLTDIDQFVNIDLQNRFTNGEIPAGPTQILQASGTDLDIALESAGQGDLDNPSNDLDSARSDVEGNIQVFRQFFVKAFQDAVKREAAFVSDESMSSGANRPHGQPLAELCMLWLFTSNSHYSKGAVLQNWPDADTQAVCEKTLYFNANINPSPSPSPAIGGASGAVALTPAFDVGALAQQMSALSFSDRVCAFHRYKIQNKADTLYQIQPAN